MNLIDDPVPMQIDNAFTVYTPQEVLNIYSNLENRINTLINMYNTNHYKQKKLIRTLNYLFETILHYLEEIYKSNMYNKTEVYNKATVINKKFQLYRAEIEAIKKNNKYLLI